MQDVRLYFVERFENDYIIALQEREFYNNKKFRNDSQLIENNVVLIKEDNIPRMSWRRGRIVKHIKTADELVRGAEIKVYQSSKGKTSILKRLLQHLVPFEIVDCKHGDILIEDNRSGKFNDNTQRNSTPTRPRRHAAINSDIIRRLITNEDNND